MDSIPQSQHSPKQRRPLSPGRLALAVFLLQVLVAGVFVLSGACAVRLIDHNGIAAEQHRASHTLAGLSEALTAPLTSGAAARIGAAAGLKGAHFAAATAVGPNEVAVPVPPRLRPNEDLTMLAWTPHRFGTQSWRNLAPMRLSMGAIAIALMGLLLLRFKRMADELERRRRVARELAVRDSLTGLANRLAFEQGLDAELAATRRDGRPLTVLYLDLNDFKGVNDRLGHPAGDALLREVAARIRGAVRPGDLVARFGGDEFAIMLTGTGDAQTAARFAARLHATLAAPYEIAGRLVTAPASIGMALAPKHGQVRDQLLARADRALYAAKDRPRARFVVYRRGLHAPGHGGEDDAVPLVA